MHVERRVLLQMAASSLLGAQLAAGFSVAAPAPGVSDESILLALARLAEDLFPHKSVSDQKYQDIARHFFTQDREMSRRIVSTVSKGKTFKDFPASERHARIAAVILTPDFQAYRFAVLLGLYDDLSITRQFGYEGPSFEQFGYIDRGFNDLNWLPEPPVATARDRGLAGGGH